MIKIENFDILTPSGISYGGHGGSKKGVIIEGEKWFLKYPKSTKSMQVENLSYNTSPLSEYLGSKIYETLKIPTHKTKLGIANEKVVVACKDFLNSSEVIIDFNAIKNEYDESLEKEIEQIKTSSKTSLNELNELLVVMEKNSYFKLMPELKERFWDMFIIDAFISNNDRDEENWGIILDKETKNKTVAPVYDNGASFYNKSSDEKLESILSDNFKFKQSVYESVISIFTENDKPINPLKYIESCKNEDANKAILRIVPRINLKEIKNIFDEIPEEYKGFPILTNTQKTFYLKSLEYKYNNVLMPTYNKLKERNI